MPVNLRLVEPAVARVLQRVSKNHRRSTDVEYGRADRKYLRPAEVESLIRAAKAWRHGVRDALMISVAYHHAMRVSELIDLRSDAIDLKAGSIKVSRKKGGIDGVQHLSQADARALRALKFKADARALRALKFKADGSPFVFLSERGGLQLTRDAFAKMLAAAGTRAGIDRRLCHPHALRRGAVDVLANSGRVNEYQLQAVMGHRNPRSTRIYVQGVAGLIKGLWD